MTKLFTTSDMIYTIRTAVLLLFGFALTGCSYTNEITRTKHDIEHYTAIDAQTGVVLSMGPGLFNTAGFIAKFVDDEDAQMASRVAYGIRRIKVGVYPLSRRFDFDDADFDELDIPEMQRFKKRGWKAALKVVDYDEVGWILYREKNRRVRDMFVVVVTDSELVLARIQGNLTELLELALEEVERDAGDGFFDDWANWEF